jgi:hypothetical protein
MTYWKLYGNNENLLGTIKIQCVGGKNGIPWMNVGSSYWLLRNLMPFLFKLLSRA